MLQRYGNKMQNLHEKATKWTMNGNRKNTEWRQNRSRTNTKGTKKGYGSDKEVIWNKHGWKSNRDKIDPKLKGTTTEWQQNGNRKTTVWTQEDHRADMVQTRTVGTSAFPRLMTSQKDLVSD